MIHATDLHKFGVGLLAPAQIEETAVRRAISSLYYGLFHRLAAEGACFFAAGGPVLAGQVARAYDHSSMRKSCEMFARGRRQPMPPPLSGMLPNGPDPRLIVVADAFIRLQAARHAADYDIAAAFSRWDGLEMMEIATAAHDELDALAGSTDLAVFVAALLLADRWTRRG